MLINTISLSARTPRRFGPAGAADDPNPGVEQAPSTMPATGRRCAKFHPLGVGESEGDLAVQLTGGPTRGDGTVAMGSGQRNKWTRAAKCLQMLGVKMTGAEDADQKEDSPTIWAKAHS